MSASALTSALTLASALFIGCAGESFSERCQREAEEYTLRQCPHQVTDFLREDSMVYVADPEGFCYYNTFLTDTTSTNDTDSLLHAILDEGTIDGLRTSLLNAIRSSIAMKAYKEHGFVFTFVCRSAASQSEVLRFTYLPEDYQ